MNKLSFTPSPAIEGKFRVVNTHMPMLHSRIGLIDFRIISEEQAQALVDYGCIYIEVIPAKKLKAQKS